MTETDDRFFLGVELGGTKCVAVLAQGAAIVERETVATRAPEPTLGELSEQLLAWNRSHAIAALGIASFGPICLDARSPFHGQMYDTPKPGWSGIDIGGSLARGLSCLWSIDTDVNAAALAEHRWGGGVGADSLCYITIGTGVGGGLVIAGTPVHGSMHPEIGHVRLRRAPGDTFEGVCAFHKDCSEGLLCGPALAARFGADMATVKSDDPRWAHVASDLAELAGNILLVTSAERILIGGGVGMGRPELLAAARRILIERLGSYLPFLDEARAAEIVRHPTLGADAGPLGSIALAMAA